MSQLEDQENKKIEILVQELQSVSDTNRGSHEGVIANSLAIFGRILHSLAIQADNSSKTNLKLQEKVVRLTWALFWITFFLSLVAAIQVYVLLQDRP